ncbi:hypothetical protein KOI35_46100 [Actinoplanes bogorensis]|uniref:Uncharacterized protein n=1 Tax=Paractinoplanes bogorensis TaxID=1610840 RepID=A0ABS5Z5B9_9ACTN|nr:hypothetical protein [Actinoplanes bogorensis]MBU2670897.1 hypothetical protein [Actinoplanes bogorensis]
MGNEKTTSVHVGLHELDGLRWPKEPLSGTGPRRPIAVPLPRLPWSTAAVEVPLGESAEGGIARVTRLRKIFGYGVAPTIILLFVVADVLLLWGRFGSLDVPGGLFGVFGVAGVVLILTGLLPDVVARATGTPYVSRGRLRFPAARNDVLGQLVKLNPQIDVSGWPRGDLQSRR